MIVVRSDAMGGMPPAALRQILGISEAELLVTIRIEGDGPGTPPAPQPPAGHPEPQADSPSISSLGITGGQTDSSSAEDQDEGTSAVHDDAPIGRRLRQSTERDHGPGGPVPPSTDAVLGSTEDAPPSAHPAAEDRGFNFTALADMARDRRMTLTYVGGVYTLIGAFKMMHFHSLAQVHDAMRHNRY